MAQAHAGGRGAGPGSTRGRRRPPAQGPHLVTSAGVSCDLSDLERPSVCPVLSDTQARGLGNNRKVAKLEEGAARKRKCC